MKELLDFISHNFGPIIIFFLLFGAGIYNFFNRILERRHELKMMEQRRQIAEKLEDSIRLLLVDREMAQEISNRLRVELAAEETVSPPALTGQAEEDAEAEALAVAAEEPENDEEKRGAMTVRSGPVRARLPASNSFGCFFVGSSKKPLRDEAAKKKRKSR